MGPCVGWPWGLMLRKPASWLVPQRGPLPLGGRGCLGGSLELTCTDKPSTKEARGPCSSGERPRALLE